MTRPQKKRRGDSAFLLLKTAGDSIILLFIQSFETLVKKWKENAFSGRTEETDVKKWIRGGRVIDPSCGRDEICDLLIDGGVIAAVGGDFSAEGAEEVIDAAGLVVAPGLVDMHTHMREPGFEKKETIATGTAAAARGGVTTLLAMANTLPVIDSPERVGELYRRAEQDAKVRLYTVAAVSRGMQGKEITDVEELLAAGAAALSDDGVPLMNAAIMREALIRMKPSGLPILSHSEDGDLVRAGVMNEGALSRKLGYQGRPAVAEELLLVRDGMLAADVDGSVHICHVSTKGSVGYIRMMKEAGVKITAETCPQYFTITEEEIEKQGAMAKVNPPLRRQADVEAILEGLKDGTLDCIVTDHAPHTAEEKSRPLPNTPSGMVGLETSLALSLTVLHHQQGLPLSFVIEKMSTAPAKILKLDAGTLRPGAPADLVLFDPDERWVVDPEQFASKGRNTPFAGWELQGRVHRTLVGGETVYDGSAVR